MELQGKLTSKEAQWTYLLAGRAVVTLENSETGNRFTYKVKGLEKDDGTMLYFVSVLSGHDNDSDYAYMGTIFADGRFKLTKKSRISAEAASYKAFYWLYEMLKQGKELPEQVNFYHAGTCGRCGRTLTVPESIETGMGPHCRNAA